jgi:hypothetical protein
LKTTAKIADASPAEPASGQSTATASEYRFVSKDGAYATPWRLLPKGGIAGEIGKLKPDQMKQLGEHYGLQLKKAQTTSMSVNAR